MFKTICELNNICQTKALEEIIQLAAEIAREGREGRKIGTMLIIGDEQAVLRKSRPLILDPLQGHHPEVKTIHDVNMRETAKELAQLDGAFIVAGDGTFISAARYVNADSNGISLPLGLGARHMAAAAITRETKAVAIVVSESSVVRVFNQGRIVAEAIPETSMLSREVSYIGTQPVRDKRSEV
jgi:DNA integrity scanning protein DisA with diadenylate cyclase activity